MKTAIITGASSGIGRAFARQLAREEIRLILCARNEEKLLRVKEELSAQFPQCKTEIMPVDLSSMDGVSRLEEVIAQESELEYMFNNAGFGIGGQTYPDNDINRSTEMITTHCIAVERLSYAAAKVMRKNGRGYIVNTASVAAFLAAKGAADYSATKAYIVAFTKGLACDLKGTGVRAMALCPGFVRTGFHSTPEMLPDAQLYDKIPNWLWLNADVVARKTIRAVNFTSKSIYVPSLIYKIAVYFLKRFG